ncbi:50S ribosomal protein L29 [Helicobacter anseris]|uniref:Large ribosomal subunit protein uL29 n=2 Tax=Helicobacter anseris TaxID=375926 RepID=A0A3D8J7I7_9HELI|nr:50S ribosomal protein L29 [Helicobacter anseris]
MKMKFIELKDKDINELKSMLKEKKAELFKLRLELKTMQLTNPSQIAVVRKDIARINTAISAKENS